MCLDLHKSSRGILVAETDIVVYKYLKIRSGGSLITPFQYSPVVIGETYESKLNVRLYSDLNLDNDELPDDLIVGFVSEGLHSFGEFKNAYKQYKYDKCERVVVKCIIPKGSQYYIGKFDEHLSYASEKLTYVKKYNSLTIYFKKLFK